MKFQEITLNQLATIHDEATDLQTHHAGNQTIFTGNHPQHGSFIMHQVGASDEAILIQL
ncbi:hypothetical protein Q9L42_004625 [Methylomarinum sp. Ch1-1]|uniref:Uncharacterized protein n=1 Tax=Methylomarinum roseum TaxID=3067653 RepID=A0AAU7NWS1_9GAMM|nr:hypothetical protein [Methylomarinum sp. Ch1-1]MDP4522517.1 hypothetical protein [Methylomarinum sp. Ch1-1]